MDEYKINCGKFYSVNFRNSKVQNSKLELENECKEFCNTLGIFIIFNSENIYTKLVCNLITKNNILNIENCGVFSDIFGKTVRKMFLESMKRNFSFKKFMKNGYMEVKRKYPDEINVENYMCFVLILIKLYLSFFYRTEKRVDNLFGKIIDDKTLKIFIYNALGSQYCFDVINELLDDIIANNPLDINVKFYQIEKIYNKYVELIGEQNFEIDEKRKYINDLYIKLMENSNKDITYDYVTDNILYLYEEYYSTVFDWNRILKGLFK